MEITHSEALELIAKTFGYENWNILSAKIDTAQPRSEPDMDQASIFLRICLWPLPVQIRPVTMSSIEAGAGKRRRRIIAGPVGAFILSSTEASMANLYFEELEIGIRSAAGPYSLSKEEIIRFAKQYDPIPRHIDEELAAQSVFGGLTASGSHTFAIYILLSGQLQPHFRVLMGLGWDELKLTNPVRPGDALDLEMTVLELRPSKSKPDWGIVRNRNLLRNQKRETVLECISTIFVARQTEANSQPSR